MTRLLLVGLGGMLGSCARYLVSGWLLDALGAEFPYGTLAVNLIGSFLIGIIMAIGLHTAILGPGTRLTLTTGFLGGFTTYSTFNYETVRLLQERAWLFGALNIAVTLVGCLLAGWLGWAGTGWLLAGRHQP